MLMCELPQIIANGKNSGIEFLSDAAEPVRMAKHAVAMANLKGGSFLLGVEDDGSISGIQRPDLEHWVMDTVFGQYVHPMILPYFEVATLDDGKLAAYLRTHTFKTVIGDVTYGKDGEWAEPRLVWTQFQGIKGNDLTQFENPATEVVLLPASVKSGSLIEPYVAGTS